MVHRVKHRRVLNLRGDEMTVVVRRGDAANGEIIGFGAAADKNDFAGRRVDQRRNFTAGALDDCLGALAESMHRLRIAIDFVKARQHRLDDFGQDGGRRAVV